LLNSNRYFFLILFMFLLVSLLSAAPEVRIKDIAYLSGIRDNQLLGIGLVTGLAGRGDSSNSKLLKNAVSNLVAHFGFDISPDDIRSRNCAVVMVVATVPAFVRPGDRIDIAISSIGDARSLEQGILLQTPLKGANNVVYAVAQGKVEVTGGRDSVKTVGRIFEGAIIEREIISQFVQGNTISIVLRNPDFVTASAITGAIKAKYENIDITTLDASLIRITIPEDKKNDVISFIAELESLTVTPDTSGKVVIDSASGVIIMGEHVRISKVAVSYKNIDVTVGGFSSVNQQNDKMSFVFPETTSVDDFVKTMKDIGIKTDSIIEILKAVNNAGALHGELIIN
jgi:flagellar P-ring protein precursor FlgI